MKSRTAEAAHLESSYLLRIKESLGTQSPSEIDEIIESLQEHIEQELAESSKEPVGLVDMANVLEQLGPPEAYSQEFDAPPASQATDPGTATPATTPRLQPRVGEIADLLDKIWIAYAIYVLGLFVPVIDFQVCALVAFGILTLVLTRNELDEELKPAGKALGITAIILLVMPIIMLIALAAPPVMLLAFPLLCGQIVCELFAFWRIMRRTGHFLETVGQRSVAEKVYAARVGYTVYYFIAVLVAVIIGAVIGVEGGRIAEFWFIGLFFLPFHWFFGWLLILRPLGQARRALRSAV